MTFSSVMSVSAVIVASAWSALTAQERDIKVRNDRAAFAEDESWVYNDLERGFAEARASGKPLLVVLRCVP